MTQQYTLWPEYSTSWTQSLKQLLRKHSQAVTIVGAVIVFTTFIVKDAIREDMKDLVDSINSAELRYRNAMDLAMVSKEVIDVEVYIKAGREPSDSQPVTDLNAIVAAVDVNSMTRFLYQNLVALNDRLPQRNELLSDLEKHGKHLDELRDNIHSAGTGIKHPQPNVAVATVGQLKFFVSATWWEYWQYILPTGEKLLEKADKLKEKRERNYKTCTYISYALFAIGWSLALMGKLLGVEVSGSE